MYWVLYIIFVIMAFAQFGPPSKELKFAEKLLIFFIISVGAPFIMLGSLLIGIIDDILPEGWDDNDDT